LVYFLVLLFQIHVQYYKIQHSFGKYSAVC
jgi:hypothetical protein